MNKTAAPKTTSTTKTSDNQSVNSALIARSNFIAATVSMSWQLAIVFLIPVIGGYELDKVTKTSPIFFLIGFVLAMTLSVLVVRRFYVEFNKINAMGDKK